jgi:hypothetical protein
VARLATWSTVSLLDTTIKESDMRPGGDFQITFNFEIVELIAFCEDLIETTLAEHESSPKIKTRVFWEKVENAQEIVKLFYVGKLKGNHYMPLMETNDDSPFTLEMDLSPLFSADLDYCYSINDRIVPSISGELCNSMYILMHRL